MQRLGVLSLSAMVAFVVQSTERPAAKLSDGAVLEYFANGQPQPAWPIDSVRFDVAHQGRSGCSRLFFGKRADAPEPYDRVVCVDKGVLYEWDRRERKFVAQRPTVANQRLVLNRPNGDTVVVTTSVPEVDVVSAVQVDVLPTIMITYDSLGQVKRRLRERYALGLATATSGIFERPSADAPSGWAVTQEFKLAALRRK